MLSKFASASFVSTILAVIILSLASVHFGFTSGSGEGIVVPSRLRGPLDIWETTIQLRKSYIDILPGSSATDRDEARRYLFLEPLSFPRNISSPESRQHLDASDDHDPFWSGRALEDPTLFLQFDKKVVLDHAGNPEYEDHKHENPLLSMQVVLNKEAWGTGCFRAYVRDIDTDTIISQSKINCPAVSSRGNYVTLPLPSESVIKRSWDHEGAGFWRVTAEFERPETTTFSFIAPGGFEKDLLLSHEKYDVTPDNASLGFKFMFQMDQKHESFEVWAFRKPPMPDFRLSFFVDKKPIFSESVNSIGQTAHAFGVRHQIEESEFDNFHGKEVAMFATFVEPRRQFVAQVQVEDLSRTISDDLVGASLPNKEGQNYREIVMQVPNDDVKSQLAGNLKTNVEYVFRYFPSSNFAGFYVNFPFPVKNVLVSLWVLEKETKRRIHLFMREGDADIPFVVRASKAAGNGDSGNNDNDHLLYGWDDALPIVAVDQATQETHRFHSIMENPFDIEVQFDKLHHDTPSLSNVLESWIHNAGGDVEKIELDYLNVAHHSHAKPFPLKMKVPLAQWSDDSHDADVKKRAIVVVPMYSIFSASVAMSSGWAKIVAAHTTELQQFLLREKLHSDSIQFLYLTLASLSHVYDGSHNFRPLFHTFEQSAVNLPPLYHTEELNLFSFSAAFAFERSRMITMWNTEYEAVAKLESKLRREISRDMYFFHRSQIEARAVNGSNGEMQLIPVVDLAPHSDDPSAELRFDEEDGAVILVPTRNLKAGDEVTINYGTATHSTDAKQTKVTKTQLGFLLQHGVVPEGASKSSGFVVKNKKGEERIFALFWGHPDSMEGYLRYLYHGERFDDELTQEELEKLLEKNLISSEDVEPARQKLVEILENKLNSLPSDIPDVSDKLLVEREMEKVRAVTNSKHFKHHHRKHAAHKERPLTRLRASFDAARENAQKLLQSEKTTLEYFISYLNKEHQEKEGVKEM